jgi:hypothetical protein
MTNGMASGMACRDCGSRNDVGDLFCGECGAAIGIAPPPSPVPDARAAASSGGDEVTRYLCAAAHLDADFADAVISEYLMEETRALPPAPGLDTAAVLREAVAARRRRQIRDVVLSVLLIGMAVASFGTFVLWLVVAAVGAVMSTGRNGRARLVVAGLVALVGAVVLAGGLGMIGLSYRLGISLGGASVELVVFAVLGLLAAVLVLADASVVDELTRRRFRRRGFVADATTLPGGWERTARTLGQDGHRRQLDRVAERDRRGAEPGFAEVVVFRTRSPFVGGGWILRDEVLALPLVEDEDSDVEATPFTVVDLHDHLAAGLDALRSGTGSLSLSSRLAGLDMVEQVLILAEKLLRESGTTMRSTVLPDLRRPPVDFLDVRQARQLADAPQEAARYYRCYRLESWDREIATSTYVTAGTDGVTLYLEWTHTLVFPLRRRYRAIDARKGTGVFRRAVEDIVLMPATVPIRAVRDFRSLTVPPNTAPDDVDPDRYGAGLSLREVAAADDVDGFLQEADAIRYLRVVEKTIFDSLRVFFEEHGYATDDILGAARAKVSNNFTNLMVNDGVFIDSAVGIGAVSRNGGSRARGAQKEQK